MRDGLYKVIFRSSGALASGVAYVAGSRLWGGGAHFFLSGTCDSRADKLEIRLKLRCEDVDPQSAPFPTGCETSYVLRGEWDSVSSKLTAEGAEGDPSAALTTTMLFLTD